MIFIHSLHLTNYPPWSWLRIVSNEKSSLKLRHSAAEYNEGRKEIKAFQQTYFSIKKYCEENCYNTFWKVYFPALLNHMKLMSLWTYGGDWSARANHFGDYNIDLPTSVNLWPAVSSITERCKRKSLTLDQSIGFTAGSPVSIPMEHSKIS